MSTFFEALASDGIAYLIDGAERLACYAGPGIQPSTADALIRAAGRLGPEMVIVCLDFDEHVLRMGFGTLDAVRSLRDAGIEITSTAGLRMGLAIADDEGVAFAPTALYLEAEDHTGRGLNAMRLAPDQAKEALARLSPAAKAAATVLARTPEEKARLSSLEIETATIPVDDASVQKLAEKLDLAPVANFDVTRQVRVYNARIQYVTMELRNASIERRRIAIPKSILQLGAGAELEGRLKTTFDLIEHGSSLSSRPLATRVAKLRDAFAPSLGKKFGRVMLKANKIAFEKRVAEIRAEVKAHQEKVRLELQSHIDQSRAAIVAHYTPIANDHMPDEAIGLFGSDAGQWIDSELEKTFPSAADLIESIALDVDYKDVTYETLQDPKFIAALKEKIPGADWDRAHEEYLAVGEA